MLLLLLLRCVGMVSVVVLVGGGRGGRDVAQAADLVS